MITKYGTWVVVCVWPFINMCVKEGNVKGKKKKIEHAEQRLSEKILEIPDFVSLL